MRAWPPPSHALAMRRIAAASGGHSSGDGWGCLEGMGPKIFVERRKNF